MLSHSLYVLCNADWSTSVGVGGTSSPASWRDCRFSYKLTTIWEYSTCNNTTIQE